MNKNLKNFYNEIDDFFSQPQTENQKAWGIIHDFYHQILTYMEENNITKAELAKRLGKSRAAISQMFNKTPNITLLKMIEIANAVGVEINIETNYFREKREANKKVKIEYVYAAPDINFENLYYTPIDKDKMRTAKKGNVQWLNTELHKKNQLEYTGQMDNN